MKWRFSLRQLLLIVGGSTVFVTSLANASVFWASLSLSLSLLVLAISLLAVVFQREEARAYWIGFLIFGAGYLLLVFAPGFDRVIGHRLVTTKVLGYLEPKVRRTEDSLQRMFNATSVTAATDPFQEALFNLTETNEAPLPQWGHFQEAGHAAFALILAALGGAVAQHFFARSRDAAVTP